MVDQEPLPHSTWINSHPACILPLSLVGSSPTLARPLIRLIGKKRGRHHSVSHRVGMWGDFAFSLTLLIFGVLAGIALISRTRHSGPELSVDIWLMALVVLTFIIFGAQGLIRSILQSRMGDGLRFSFQRNVTKFDFSQRVRGGLKLPNVPLFDTILTSRGTVQKWRLPMTTGQPVKTLAVIIFFSIWVCISVVLIYYSVSQYLGTEDELHFSWWLPILSLPPSIGLSIWAGRFLKDQLQGRITIDPLKLEISQQPLYPGQKYEVTAIQRGLLHVRSLRIFLVCEEITSFHQGTDVRTETHEVIRERVFQQRRFEIKSGEPLKETFQIEIPADAMHSFQGHYNSLQWKLVSIGRYRDLPEIQRNYALIVHPSSPLASVEGESS